jgi:MerR family transcriptional regulator/heat shock protein HspR
MTKIIINKFEAVLTIGTVASKLNVSVQTLRSYEQEGLVLPAKTKGGRRMYSLHDFDRLICIRDMITKHGLNLNGIKQMMSMIPCWEYRGGLDEECQKCPVYYEAKGPCWTRSDIGPKCQEVDCRDCPVYRLEIHCDKIKEVVFGHVAPDK